MTHFIVLILVPSNIIALGDHAVNQYIENKLNQYAEDYPVEPYIEMTKEEIRADFKKYKLDHDDCEYENVKDYAKDYYGYELDNEGNALSSTNNSSFYDWYVIGGRWDGYLTGQPNYGFNFGVEHHTVIKNSLPVSELLNKLNIINEEGEKKYILNHIVDENGDYHESHDVGWFGMSIQKVEDDEWFQKYKQILERCEEDYHVVSLDCHI